MNSARKVRVGILCGILLGVAVTWNVAAQEESSLVSINLDVGVVYSHAQWEGNIEDTLAQKFILSNFRAGADFEVDFNLISWFAISAEVGAYGFYNFVESKGGVTLEFPVRVGPKFSFGFFGIKPYVGWMPMVLATTKFEVVEANLLQNFEIGGAIELGPVELIAGYVFEISDIHGVAKAPSVTAVKEKVYKGLQKGYFRVGVSFELFEIDF